MRTTVQVGGCRSVLSVANVNPATLQQVVQLVAESTGVRESRITESTRLGEDLGMDGDDASDLITAFAKRFRVDLKAFVFSRHFGPEVGFSPFSIHPRPALTPITIVDLAEAVERGAWPPKGNG